ncbi:MAG: GTP pyrophosphokinase family protein [Acidimicrobiales bacterium]
MTSTATAALGYAAFGAWYDRYRAAVLEPALAAADAALDATLREQLGDRDLARIRNTGGRVKSKRRTWRKLQQPRYRGKVSDPDAVPGIIDDLVGLRITCTNLRDIDMVQAALDGLPRHPEKGGGLWLDPASERDYVAHPKDSGYRGWHVNLGVSVPTDAGPVPVVCELQVRTLLQDSWGELTHEDTYSKDGALPPLVEILSSRMADLFATLDDIAEDLRTELDRIDEAVVSESVPEAPDEALPGGAGDSDAPTEQADDAAAVLQARWRGADRPIDLASLAWTLQREFGAEVSDDWFGHRTFKRFLRHAVPDGEISTGRQAYLLPPPAVADTNASTDSTGATDLRQATTTLEATEEGAEPLGEAPTVSTIPDAARRLRQVDRGFPLLEAPQWPELYRHLAEAWQSHGSAKASARVVNQLTRSARDRAEAGGSELSRRSFAHVAWVVLGQDGAGEPLDAATIADTFIAATLQRMEDLRIVGQSDRKARSVIGRWLRGG